MRHEQLDAIFDCPLQERDLDPATRAPDYRRRLSNASMVLEKRLHNMGLDPAYAAVTDLQLFADEIDDVDSDDEEGIEDRLAEFIELARRKAARDLKWAEMAALIARTSATPQGLDAFTREAAELVRGIRWDGKVMFHKRLATIREAIDRSFEHITKLLESELAGVDDAEILHAVAMGILGPARGGRYGTPPAAVHEALCEWLRSRLTGYRHADAESWRVVNIVLWGCGAGRALSVSSAGWTGIWNHSLTALQELAIGDAVWSINKYLALRLLRFSTYDSGETDANIDPSWMDAADVARAVTAPPDELVGTGDMRLHFGISQAVLATATRPLLAVSPQVKRRFTVVSGSASVVVRRKDRETGDVEETARWELRPGQEISVLGLSGRELLSKLEIADAPQLTGVKLSRTPAPPGDRELSVRLEDDVSIEWSGPPESRRIRVHPEPSKAESHVANWTLTRPDDLLAEGRRIVLGHRNNHVLRDNSVGGFAICEGFQHLAATGRSVTVDGRSERLRFRIVDRIDRSPVGACRETYWARVRRQRLVAVDARGPVDLNSRGRTRLASVEVRSCRSCGAKRVTTLAFHPGKPLLATAGDAATVQLWSLDIDARGRVTASKTVLDGHTAEIRALAFSPGGDILASGSADGTARLWHVADGAPPGMLEGHGLGINALAFSPNGGILATGGQDGTVRLWQTAGGVPLRVLEAHRGPVRALAISRDGKLLASAGDDGVPRVWRLPEGAPLHAPREGHQGAIVALTFVAGGELLATAGGDGTVRLWQMSDGALRKVLRGHDGPVWSLAANSKGNLLATAGEDGTARRWSVPDGVFLPPVLSDHDDGLTAVTFDTAGERLATAGRDCRARIWEADSGRLVARIKGHQGWMETLAFSTDGRWLATGGRDDKALLWRADDAAKLKVLSRTTKQNKLHTALHPDARDPDADNPDATRCPRLRFHGRQTARCNGSPGSGPPSTVWVPVGEEPYPSVSGLGSEFAERRLAKAESNAFESAGDSSEAADEEGSDETGSLGPSGTDSIVRVQEGVDYRKGRRPPLKSGDTASSGDAGPWHGDDDQESSSAGLDGGEGSSGDDHDPSDTLPEGDARPDEGGRS